MMKEEFSEGGAGQVFQFYRETIEIVTAALPSHDAYAPLAKEAQIPATTSNPAVPVGQQVAPPLAGKPFTVAFDGSLLTGTIAIRSVRDIDRLMKVLKAQKAAFEAMQEDDENNDEFEEVDAA